MAKTLPDWAYEFVRTARVGHLATANSDAEPHVVPFCFVLLDGVVYSVVDQKPKSGRRLRRLRNIESTGNAAVVVDHYDDDWSQLAFAMGRGSARILGPDDPEHAPALAALREKYHQYRSMDLDDAEMVELRPSRWTAWRASGD